MIEIRLQMGGYSAATIYISEKILSWLKGTKNMMWGPLYSHINYKERAGVDVLPYIGSIT